MEMETIVRTAPSARGGNRGRCYGCFRPTDDCFCAAVPTIENLTEVLILQHMRERFHPFNTARIVHRALKRSRLLVDHTPNLAARLSLQPGAGLLFPGPGAQLLGELPVDQRPPQLVVLDGTWHHAKTLLRDIPALQLLPRFQLAPTASSRYRIRREPKTNYLSTVEATVAALRVLEPGTGGLQQLLQAFDQMVERQLEHPWVEYTWRRRDRRRQTVGNIPQALLSGLDNIVVANGESTPGQRGGRRQPKAPIYWVAQRLVTGERFACTIRQDCSLPESFLKHLELTSADFAVAVSFDEARNSWMTFLRSDDTLVVYHQGAARLLRTFGASSQKLLMLKSVAVHASQQAGTLEERVAGERLVVAPAPFAGRAGRSLAQLTALVHQLHAFGQ